MYVRSITEHFFRFYLLRKDPHNLFLFPLLNILFFLPYIFLILIESFHDLFPERINPPILSISKNET